MVNWNRIFWLFWFSRILGQPCKVHSKFLNEILEKYLFHLLPHQKFWSYGKCPYPFFSALQYSFILVGHDLWFFLMKKRVLKVICWRKVNVFFKWNQHLNLIRVDVKSTFKWNEYFCGHIFSEWANLVKKFLLLFLQQKISKKYCLDNWVFCIC